MTLAWPRPRADVATFLCLIALVYFIAFTSFGVQLTPLIGSHGLSPASDYFSAAREQLGATAYWELPSLFWLNSSDSALHAAWILGAIAALFAIFSSWRRSALAVCLILWLSLCIAGQTFLSYQWDMLLLEAGLLACFADDSPIRIWLFRWLLFRLMFSSGVVKLASHDPTWRDLTALHFHYETQPLPTPLAWYLEQAPMWFQKASTFFTFLVELAVPFLFFAPTRFRRIRHVAGWLTLALQILILFSGNYTYFNLLTMMLALFLFIEPVKQDRGPTHQSVDVALASFVGLVSACLVCQLFSVRLPGENALLRFTEPLRVVNSYGLFAVMTTERPEIVIEGSNDGVDWRPYELPYKAGDVHRAPSWVAPHQPRLDWQLWFAAMEHYQENPWFILMMKRLLEGDATLLRLFETNPFPKSPPKFIRARLFVYHFTHWGSKDWWTREEKGLYFPAVSLK